MSTNHLLMALRRFFARRGVPASITSDNGSNFILAEQILHDLVLPTINDVSFIQSVATKGIVWKTIIPYAPWQGGLYERMIKSIKHGLYKVLQRRVPDEKTLETFLVEIEGCINTRPLTYQEERWDETPALRPIDFIQRDMVTTYSFESVGMDNTDPDYLPTDGIVILQTRQQAEEALKTSHQLTEHFWKVWSQQYLTTLRESHKLDITNKRSTPKTSSLGKVVLINEPLLPRNTWKMGRIMKVHRSHNEVIRDVELRTPSGRTIRRAINLLIPLEVGDSNPQEQTESDTSESQSRPRYNLRPLPRNKYTSTTSVNCSATHTLPSPTTAFLPEMAASPTITHSATTTLISPTTVFLPEMAASPTQTHSSVTDQTSTILLHPVKPFTRKTSTKNSTSYRISPIDQLAIRETIQQDPFLHKMLPKTSTEWTFSTSNQKGEYATLPGKELLNTRRLNDTVIMGIPKERGNRSSSRRQQQEKNPAKTMEEDENDEEDNHPSRGGEYIDSSII